VRLAGETLSPASAFADATLIKPAMASPVI
jgi:hypothetical protein